MFKSSAFRFLAGTRQLRSAELCPAPPQRSRAEAEPNRSDSFFSNRKTGSWRRVRPVPPRSPKVPLELGFGQTTARPAALLPPRPHDGVPALPPFPGYPG